MANTKKENATNASLQKIQQMVNRIKSDEEVSIEYMKIAEREDMIREESKAEGKAEGIAEGRAEGKVESKIEDILAFLKEHGALPVELETQITSQTDLQILSKWLKLAASVASIEEFEKSI